MKICFAANKNCKLYSILERISHSNLEELYNIKDYVQKQFKFMTEIFQQTLVKFDNIIPNDHKNIVNELNLSRMTFYKDSSINQIIFQKILLYLIIIQGLEASLILHQYIHLIKFNLPIQMQPLVYIYSPFLKLDAIINS